MPLAVTVVVPTHNRVDLLPRLFAALADQDLRDFEVVIVDDCSTDETWEVLARMAESAAMPVRTLRTERNSGPATARNLGWRAARSPRIVFTDDDCVPQPGWLRGLVAALDRADVVQGRTVPPPDARWGPFARHMLIDEWSDLFETCNMAYRREVLERFEGFDESFRRPFGEDADLGWRAAAAGISTRYEPLAVVQHDVVHRTLMSDFSAELRFHGRKVWTARLLKRHPALRRRFHLRLFYMPHHPRTLGGLLATGAALAGVGGRARVPFALAAWLPYLKYRVAVQRRLSRRATMVPVLVLGLVSDVAEVGAVLVGSARFRTLLL